MRYLKLYENYESEDWTDRAVQSLESITGYSWTLEKVRPGGTASYDEWRPNTAWLNGGGDEKIAKKKLQEAGIDTDYLSWMEGQILCVDLKKVVKKTNENRK